MTTIDVLCQAIRGDLTNDKKFGATYYKAEADDIVETIREFVGPALAARDAEIERLKELNGRLVSVFRGERRIYNSKVADLERENAELKKHVPEDGNIPLLEEAIREQEKACHPHVKSIADSIGVPLDKENYAILRGAWTLADLLEELAAKVSEKNAELRQKFTSQTIAANLDRDVAEMRRDAELWRAFIGTHRVRVIGQALNVNGYHHIGIELWSMYAGVPREESASAREAVTAFAEARRVQDSKG